MDILKEYFEWKSSAEAEWYNKDVLNFISVYYSLLCLSESHKA